ncbi:hypothetical protein BJY01DRAFT_139682 [Aspergillus pseudoustus]|uniref:Uncharacterized protein n=1 Tax=Aspergillus pseudoustus TaxID=1810923 RepID=A0ABR4IHP8_9EURO
MVASWAAFNDVERFDFGSDWRRVFEILPEIAECREMFSRRPIEGIIDMNQNITIEARLEVDQAEIDNILLSREQGSPEGMVINQGRVGDKYLLSTEFGRKYFGLTESDLEESSTVA